MSQWAARRQLAIFIGIVALFGLIAFAILWPRISVDPTCNDGKQNGTESGVDCGGSCRLMCTDQVPESVILWSRAFNISEDVYSAVAQVENPNVLSLGLSRPYEFRFYDAENEFITRVIGYATLPPNQNITIFEGGIKTGNREIKRTTFSWLQVPVWYKVNKEILDDYKVTVSDISITNEGTRPRLEAKIKNDGQTNLPSLSVIAVIYGQDGNAITASKTLSDTLPVGTESFVYFNWPSPFAEKYTRIEITPVIPGEYYAK